MGIKDFLMDANYPRLIANMELLGDAFMIPLDWEHANWWLGIAALSSSLWYFNACYERRETLRKITIVRRKLATVKCATCGGALVEWDGVFHPGNVHFNPGGYHPLLLVSCQSCQRVNSIYCCCLESFDQCTVINLEGMVSD